MDIGNGLESSWNCYADDIKLVADPKTAQGTLQDALDRMRNWSFTWLLPLNVSKYKVLHIGPQNPRLQYHLADCSLLPTVL